MLLAMLAALGALPVAVASDSDCIEQLQAVGFQRDKNAQVELVLQSSAKNRLTLRRHAQVLLTRELGEGACGEASRAALVVVSRWATSLAPDDMILLSPARETDRNTETSVEERPPVVVKRPVPAERPARKELPSPRPQPRPQPSAAPLVEAPAPEDVASRIGEAPRSIQEPLAPEVPVAPPFRIVVSHLEALFGGGLAVPDMVKQTVGPVVSIDLALVLNHRIRLGLSGLYDFGGAIALVDEDGLTRGQLEARELLLLPGVAACFEWPLRACGGLVAGARIAQGQASGEFVFQRSNGWLSSFTGGAGVQVAFIRDWFHLALDGTLLLTPTPAHFGVEGLPAGIQAPVVQGVFRLSLGFGAGN